MRLRLIPHNPATDARLPRREHVEMSAWSEHEAATFLAAVAGERLAPIWRLVLATGLRRGELAGLRWRDVSAGAIEVASTRTTGGGGSVATGPPKSRAGAWRKRIAEERLAAGPAWRDSGLVLVDELGLAPHPENISRWWREAVARSGVRPIRLHDARHSAATMMLRACVPVKVVSQRLGHAGVGITLSIYAHATAQDDQDAADTLERVLRG